MIVNSLEIKIFKLLCSLVYNYGSTSSFKKTFIVTSI